MTALPRLLIISFSPIRSDPRVLKQVALFRGKYHLITCGYGAAPEGADEHFALSADAVGWPSDRIGLLGRLYRRAYEKMSAVQQARQLLAGLSVDVVLANDLNTLPVAVDLKPKYGVHSDLHEFAPKEKDDDLKWRLFVAPFMRWLCRTYLPQARSLTTVAPGIAAQYTSDFGVAAQVVTNAAPFAAGTPKPVGETIRLIHSAAGQRYRKLENLIEAMRSAPPGVELDMIVMPNEPAYVAELKQAAADVPAVRFREPVPYAELVKTLSGYDVSLVFLPPTNFNMENALPNKFFEAVQARLGVVVGPSPSMVEIVKEYGFGTVTPDFSPSALATTIQSLDREQIMEWKRAADRAAGPLAAESQVKIWEAAIRDLLPAAESAAS
ncbi:glycosyl transferase [Arthrobacter sp. Leaf69]|uniref:glycosyl transferase n=1 Tax=Arthrobacter sp. Leaf69 TaxID=1736232 RepID=UPI0006F284F5|nr:glycosyl transferase [Arthrobacter sp. Leaf69]KQN95237.1 glycosyltransferase [Arthrobacter sp. Leaf69]